MVGFISNLAPLLNYLRRRSPGPPFPPDHRQTGERGAINLKTYKIVNLSRIPNLASEIGAHCHMFRDIDVFSAFTEAALLCATLGRALMTNHLTGGPPVSSPARASLQTTVYI